MKVDVRPATAADVVAFMDEQLPWRIRALTGVVGDRIIGMGGVTFPPNGAVLAFAKFDDDARKFPVAMHKAGLRLMAELREAGIRRVSTVPEKCVDAAERWLWRLGFVPTEQHEDMVIWTWHSSRS